MKLNDVTVRKAKPEAKPRKLSDGGGLYILIHPNGGKYWQLAYRFVGKQKTLALGVYPDVSLAAARKRRDEAREMLANSIDPGEAKQTQKREDKIAAANTFEAVAREWVENRSNDWTEAHKALTLKTLEQDAFPGLGRRPIAEISSSELLATVRAIEKRGALEIASRVLQRCGAVFRYGIATDRCKNNPAFKMSEALKSPTRTHYNTIEKGGFPQLLRDIDGYQGSPMTPYALQLMALTFTRTGELINAEWKEIDLDRAEWLIPAERMKMRRPHLVPLSVQAVAVFREAAKLSGCRVHVFPNRNDPSKPASNAIILRALGRMGYTGKMTGHGFRSAASTMLNENKSKWGIHKDTIELQLAHVEKNASRAAYNFAEYLDERRAMMQQWADYLDKLKAGAEVIQMRA
ncbi:MAG: integrase [Gallionellales bacterium CG_4_8_14_3_um_filter_54_18]|nr:MAG: integrase [Gallionellales bacterium CG_4_8_14_3_um_filter_54_18]PIY01078.1 MAG: integrase [Hydrogenophilales bacterium CG_4_10_14_3_um_filter_58_23]PJB06341.1 MAG: integrase [Hydrogenophilales bacterium CG_4_9_14_3_um_filter_59_35]